MSKNKVVESLPQESVPFSIKAPFIVASDIYKMGTTLFEKPEETLLCFDERYPDYVKAKLNMLQNYPNHSRSYLSDEQSELEQCLWELTEILAKDQPDYVFSQVDDDGQHFASKLLGISLYKDGQLKLERTSAAFPKLAEECFAHLELLSDFEKLCDLLSLCVQEDLVVMHKTGEGATDDRAECMLVAMPTHWDPKEKIGLDFGAIHKPIAHSDKFNKSQGNLMNAMTYKGPFVRYNWTLADSSSLSLNPVLLGNHSLASKDLAGITDPEELINRLYFRPERQTLIPFPKLHRSVFAIRIFHQPLRDLLTTPERKQLLGAAIASMSPEVIRYRSMAGFIDSLLMALEC